MAIEVSESGTMITGEHIEMFRVLHVMHGLALEINTGMKLSARGSVMLVAREMCGSAKRTKKGVLRDYVAWVQTFRPEFTPQSRVTQAMSK